MQTGAAVRTVRRVATMPRVLYVDDDPRAIELFTAQTGHEYVVVSATNGAAALEVLASGEPFAVVVSDMEMGVMNGIAFLSRVAARWPESLRLLMTGHADLNTPL